MADRGMNRLALVTGASGGIGLELAKLLAADGFDVALVARNQQKLESISREFHERFSVQPIVIVADLAKPDAAAEIARRLEYDSRPIEVLINNAGVGTFGPFHEQPLEKILELLQINIVSLTELTRRLLPRFVAHGDGHVMNVASTAAFQPGPLMAVYYASKVYVLHLSEAIGEELSNTNIKVTALCPGPTSTEFEQRADMQGSKLFSSHRVMTAEQVARIGYRGMWQGKAVVIPGFTNRFLAWATRLPPRSWLPKFARWAQEKN
jgi:short-subunit dehydrogenase